MPEHQKPVTIDTLGALVEHRMTLTVYCHRRACGHHHQLDLEALAARLGRDHPTLAPVLLPKLRCGECGARAPDISLRLGTSHMAEYRYPDYHRSSE